MTTIHRRRCAMNTALSPMVSEFETIEQENSYNEWLRAKVAASLANPRPAIPHDEVERRMAERFAKMRKERSK
ncbi:stability determinant [Escherichia coli]|nr:stability determinant [Escherichia coli]EFO0042721.1 stability determinant [Escherichia coli]EFO0565984.1 stability determinant [Escherichia coli]EFO0695465.1 stability determinant [Escherichia coli]EFO1422793.1 stability determinant [Escherichia coli]